MPAPARRSASRSSGGRSSGKKSDGSGLFVLLGLAGAGTVAYLLSSKTASAAEGGGSTTSTSTPPKTSKAPTSKSTADLSEYLKQQMAMALGMLGVDPGTGKLNGAANAEAIQFGSQVVGMLDAEGFHDAAKALRQYVDLAAKAVATPANAAAISAAAPTVLTQDQRDYIARVLTLERDPKNISALIEWLKTLPPSPERDSTIQMAQALVLQLAAAQATSQTLQQIDAVIKSPGIPQVQQAANQPQPPVKVPVPTPMVREPEDYVPPQYSPPKVTAAPPPSALPDTPVTVPKQPVPQNVPAASSPEELAAKAMMLNLRLTQNQYGVPAAKTKYDKLLVKKFQALTNLAQDGVPGPATFLMAAGKGAVDLPLVYFWPKTATAATVQQYRDGLSAIAYKLETVGRLNEAAQLRVSLARETGQSGINGPAFGAKVTSPPAAPPKPAAAAAAAAVMTPSAVDPYPAWPLLESGDKGTMVKAWQGALVKGGFLPNKASSTDGAFGPLGVAATKLLQKKLGITQDGVVGPNARKGARALGLW